MPPKRPVCLEIMSDETGACAINACGHVLCLECVLHIIEVGSSRRCPFTCGPVSNVDDVSALSLNFERAHKLGPSYALALSKRHAQILAMEIAQSKFTRDAISNEVKGLQARVTQQWETIQRIENELSSTTIKNTQYLKDLEQLKTINEAQSVHEGVLRVRLSMMRTEKQGLLLRLREKTNVP